MKKVYLNPEMEMVEIDMSQMIMAGSPLPKSDSEVDTDDILAPPMHDYEDSELFSE